MCNKDIITTSIVWLNYGCRKVQKYGGVQPFQGHVEAKFQSFILVFLQKEKKNWGVKLHPVHPPSFPPLLS